MIRDKVETILKLQKHYREALPQYTIFGDDNWKEHDLAIRLLEDTINLRSTKWFDKWLYIDEGKYKAATDVSDWLDGAFDENYFDEELDMEGIEYHWKKESTP